MTRKLPDIVRPHERAAYADRHKFGPGWRVRRRLNPAHWYGDAPPPVPDWLTACAVSCGELAAMRESAHDLLWRIAAGAAELWRAQVLHNAAEAEHEVIFSHQPLMTAIWWAFRDARDAMSIRLTLQADEARKAVGPALADGADRGAALKLARARAPEVPDAVLAAVVDEECAWWIRWRHDRGFRVDQGMAA